MSDLTHFSQWDHQHPRSTSIQQRNGERTSGYAPKHGAPPARPRRSTSPMQKVQDTLCFGPSQVAEELCRFGRETTTDFSCTTNRAPTSPCAWSPCPVGRSHVPVVGAPSQRMGLTSVVSTARLLSRTPPTPRYSSARRWSAPFHLLLGRCGPQQSPEENPFVQRSQQLSKPSDGGPSCRGDGTHECAVKESGRRNLRSSRMRTTREGQLVISSKWRPCSKVWGANHPRFTTLNSSSHTFKIPSSIAVLEIQSNAERMFEIGQHLTSRGCTAN